MVAMFATVASQRVFVWVAELVRPEFLLLLGGALGLLAWGLLAFTAWKLHCSTRDLARRLHDSEERFQTLAAATQQGVWVTEDRGNLTYVNSRLAQHLGYHVEEMIGRPVREFLTESQRTNGPEQQVQLRRKDGSTLWVPVYEAVLEDELRQPVGTLALFNDLHAAERRRSETALRASEAEFIATFELLGGGKAQTDPKTGRFVRVNRQLCYLTGYSSNQLLNMHLLDLAHPEYRSILAEQLARAIRGEVSEWTAEAQFLHQTGFAFWAYTSGTVVRDPEGRPVCCVLVIQDITDRKKAEEEVARLNRDLKRRLDELQALLDVVPVAIAVAQDPDCRQITLNPAGAALLGVPAVVNLPKSGPKGKRLPFRITRNGQELPPDQLAMTYAARNNLAVRDQEIELIRADGHVFNLLEYATPLLDEHRQVRGCLGVFVDITTRKQAENLLRESEEQFRQLANAMPQIVWAARPDGRIDYFNERWYEFTGFSPGLDAETGWQRILHPKDVGPALERWHQAVRSGEVYQTEYRLRDRTTGAYRWHLGRALPMRDVTGRIVRWFGTSTDIDDQKRAEEALLETDRRKDEFLAMLAHELRNPLAPIRNALGILRLRGPVDPLLSQAHDMMERQVGQLVRLVDDLLDVSRITSGKIKLQKEQVELRHVVQVALDTSKPLVQERRHELIVQLPQEDVRIQADPARLSQILSNLLKNAAKYTPPGGQIRLTAELINGEVIIKIRDTGIGIDAAMLPRVFDLFAQAEQSLDRSLGGLGIGLTVVRRLVEMHGGRVHAFSEGLGKGSEFVVTLPACQAPVPAIGRSDSATASPPSARPVRVLVVEDHPDAAYSIALLLNLWGHEVRLAHEAKSALEIALAFQPEVVLLDIGLPEVDGYQIARQLRQQTGLQSALLIALTGYGQEEDRRRSREAGFDLHLVKPVLPETLQNLLSQATCTIKQAGLASVAYQLDAQPREQLE